MRLPPDWEFFTGIMFHAEIIGQYLMAQRGTKMDTFEGIKNRSIKLGVQMAEAVEKKRDEYDNDDES